MAETRAVNNRHKEQWLRGLRTSTCTREAKSTSTRSSSSSARTQSYSPQQHDIVEKIHTLKESMSYVCTCVCYM